MENDQIKNIQKMESIFLESKNILEKANALLEEWKSLQPKLQSLKNYYFSPQWQEDYELSNREVLDFPHGILSEDEAYNFFITQDNTAIKYIKLMTEILEK